MQYKYRLFISNVLQNYMHYSHMSKTRNNARKIKISYYNILYVKIACGT